MPSGEHVARVGRVLDLARRQCGLRVVLPPHPAADARERGDPGRLLHQDRRAGLGPAQQPVGESRVGDLTY
jgi:hypothetical protein